MVTFIVVGNTDEALSSSSYHGVASTVIKEMKCGSPQHGYRYYCRCEVGDEYFEGVVMWYEETLQYQCNAPVGCVTVIEDYIGVSDIFHYFNEVYDEYGRRLE